MNPTLAVSNIDGKRPAAGPTSIESEQQIQSLFEALDDPDCRDILEASTEESLSTKEVSHACNIPLSTTYRKLDRLTAAGLLEESTRIHPDGKHASEYTRVVDDVIVSLDEAGGIGYSTSRHQAVS